MMNLSKKTVGLVIFALSSVCVHSQTYNPTITAVPSLAIAPDAVGGGMGDVGAATLPDVYSQYWNPSKYAFATSKAGVGLSYTPWLRKLVSDIALMQLVGYYKFGADDNQAISSSIRYFSIGSVDISNMNGDFLQQVSPYEMAFDIGYSRKLSQTFSGGVNLRYIHTDYSTATENSATTAGNAFAADVSGYNESYVIVGQNECLLGLGFNISNIGSKISTDGGNTSYFLPTNLRVGGSFSYPMDEYNSLTFSADLNKLLVPTPPIQGQNESDADFAAAKAAYNNISPISGMFKSFTDAPFSEEMKEIMWSVGAQYTYNKQFSVRAGYFHESEMKGNLKYFTMGAGFKMSVFQLDAAYLIASQANPLDQTLRLSLSFSMEGLKNLMK